MNAVDVSGAVVAIIEFNRGIDVGIAAGPGTNRANILDFQVAQTVHRAVLAVDPDEPGITAAEAVFRKPDGVVPAQRQVHDRRDRRALWRIAGRRRTPEILQHQRKKTTGLEPLEQHADLAPGLRLA